MLKVVKGCKTARKLLNKHISSLRTHITRATVAACIKDRGIEYMDMARDRGAQAIPDCLDNSHCTVG